MINNAQTVKSTDLNGRVFEGEVVSNKMDKTIVVKVNRTLKHPLLGKTIKKSKKYKAHDEENGAQIGDWVKIIECKPISKDKHAKLIQILRKAV